MLDGIKLDYIMGGTFGERRPSEFGARNILCSEKFSRLVCHPQAELTCPCGYDVYRKVTDYSMSTIMNGKCRNPTCEFGFNQITQIDKMKFLKYKK